LAKNLIKEEGMKDIDLDRKLAKDWREYLKDVWAMGGMLIWVWQEFITFKGKKLVKKMLWIRTVVYMINVANPWVLSMVFDGLNPENPQLFMVARGLALCGLAIYFGHFLNYKQMSYQELLFGENFCPLVERTTELFLEKSVGTHMDEGNLLNKTNVKKGHERVSQLKNLILFDGTESILELIFPFLALWFLDWKIALAISGMLIIHLGWSLILNQKVLGEGIPIDRKFRSMDRYRDERLDQYERVKNNAKEEDELKTLTRMAEEVINLDRKLWLWHLGQVMMRGVIDYSFLIAAMIYGAYKVWHGEMTLGLLFPLYSWTRQLADNLWRIGHIEKEINFITPAILAVKEALTMPIGLDIAKEPKHLSKETSCRIEFKNVSYIYSEQKEQKGKIRGAIPVLRNISFIIEPEERVALIGPTGVGKTTIIKLLLRHMEPTSGSILIDGIDLRELDLDSWLRLVGYISQEPQILSGTIRYNLLYGLSEKEKAKVSDDELWKIMRLLQIDFEARLTHGLKTVVGPRGIKLSGGQAQRVMIGAAVMKNPRFMIIDEATSSLDSTTEKLVQEGLKKVLTKNRGALVIAHRLGTVRSCNKFIMLSGNGHGSEIVAIANSFEELAENFSEFRILAQDQGIVL